MSVSSEQEQNSEDFKNQVIYVISVQNMASQRMSRKILPYIYQRCRELKRMYRK